MKGIQGLVLVALALPAIVPGRAVAQRSGAQVWAESCGNCHMLQPANRYKAERWAIIVGHMQINARLTDAETEAVLEFLQAGARRSAAAEPEEDGGIQLASSNPTVLAAPETEGEEVYLKQCAACHGKTGKGDGPAAVALDPRPTNLADRQRMEGRTNEELRTIIEGGIGSMPGFASILEPDELEAVLEYVRSLSAEE